MYPKKYEWAGGVSTSMGMQSHSGDCSIWIREAALEFDDGFWECQVTASDFAAQDALTSQPVRLVVRGELYFFQIYRSRYKSLLNDIRIILYRSHIIRYSCRLLRQTQAH